MRCPHPRSPINTGAWLAGKVPQLAGFMSLEVARATPTQHSAVVVGGGRTRCGCAHQGSSPAGGLGAGPRLAPLPPGWPSLPTPSCSWSHFSSPALSGLCSVASVPVFLWPRRPEGGPGGRQWPQVRRYRAPGLRVKTTQRRNVGSGGLRGRQLGKDMGARWASSLRGAHAWTRTQRPWSGTGCQAWPGGDSGRGLGLRAGVSVSKLGSPFSISSLLEFLLSGYFKVTMSSRLWAFGWSFPLFSSLIGFLKRTFFAVHQVTHFLKPQLPEDTQR